MLKYIKAGYFSALLKLVVGICANIILTKLAVNRMGLKYQAIWFLFLSIAMYLYLFDFGISESLYSKLSLSLNKWSKKIDLAKFIQPYRLSYWIILIPMYPFLLLIFYLYINYCNSSLNQTNIFLGYVYFVSSVVLQIYANFHYAIIYGRGEVSKQNYIKTIGLIFWCSLAYSFAYSFLLFCKLMFFRSLFEFALVFFHTTYILREETLRYPSCISFFPQSKAILSESNKRFLIAVGSLLIFQSDIYIIAYLYGSKSVPFYYIAIQIFSVILAFSRLPLQVMLPKILSCYKEKKTEFYRMFYFSLKISLFCIISGITYIWIYRSIIFDVWLNGTIKVNWNILLVFLILGIFELWVGFFAQVAKCAGYLHFYRVGIFLGVVNIPLSFYFAHLFGPIGVPVATLILEAFINFSYVTVVSIKYLGLSMYQLIKILAVLAVYCPVLYFVILKLHEHFYAADIKNLLFSFTIACAVILLSGAIMMFPKKTINTI